MLLRAKKFRITFWAVIVLTVMVPLFPVFAQTETIQFTSYYPAPFGSYNRIRFMPTVGPPTCVSSNEQGTVYFDKLTNKLQLCNDLGGGVYGWQQLGDTDFVWTQFGDLIYPLDTGTTTLSVVVSDNTGPVPSPPFDPRALIETQATSAGNYVSLTRDGAIEVSRNDAVTGGYIDLKSAPGKDYDARLYANGGGPAGNLHINMSSVGDILNIDPTGNVGIRTSVPNSPLQVNGITQIVDDGAIADTSAYASFGVTRANTAANLSYIGLTRQGLFPWGIGVGSNSEFMIGTAAAGRTISTPRMAIATNGFMGLGVTTPRRSLDVNGEVVAVNRMTLAQDTGTATRTWHMDNSAGDLRIFQQPNINAGGVVASRFNPQAGGAAITLSGPAWTAAGASALRVNGKIYYNDPTVKQVGPFGWTTGGSAGWTGTDCGAGDVMTGIRVQRWRDDGGDYDTMLFYIRCE